MSGIAERRKKCKAKHPRAKSIGRAEQRAEQRAERRAERRKGLKTRKPSEPKSFSYIYDEEHVIPLKPAQAPPPQPECDTPSGFREEETSRKYRDNQVDGKKLFQNLEQTPSGQRNRGSHFEKTKDQYLDRIGAAAAKRKLIKTPSPMRKALEQASEEDPEEKKSICEKMRRPKCPTGCPTQLRL